MLVGLLFLHAMNTFMDRICISAASDLIMSDLDISPLMMGCFFSIFAVGYALFQVPAGWFADAYGPKKALLIVVGFWSSFTALTGTAWNAVSMLVIRFLFGAGEAAKSNDVLVKKIRELVDFLGFEVATIEEARRLLLE
jgi:ACS family glucarate transporter-like MFS transporter